MSFLPSACTVLCARFSPFSRLREKGEQRILTCVDTHALKGKEKISAAPRRSSTLNFYTTQFESNPNKAAELTKCTCVDFAISMQSQSAYLSRLPVNVDKPASSIKQNNMSAMRTNLRLIASFHCKFRLNFSVD